MTLQPERRARSTWLTILFVTVSCTIAVRCVATRNVYDDEHTSLLYVGQSIPEIIHTANSTNVHPPGMYLLARFAFMAIPSPRWVTLVVLVVLYSGLSVFVFSVTPLLRTSREQICFLVLATLHPQLLMWGPTIRWYGWWTPLALILLIHSLQPQSIKASPDFGVWRGIRTGLLLAALFYINYCTIVFGVALGIALWFRFGLRWWKQYTLMLMVFLILISPQLHAFLLVHMAESSQQRANLAVSLMRLVQGTFISEAYLPWHPIALLAGLCFLWLLIVGVARIWRWAHLTSRTGTLRGGGSGLMSVVVFAVAFGILMALSGLGVKPRNALILIPTLAPVFALIVGGLSSEVLQSAVVGFLLLWAGIGMEHLVHRHGLAKSNMNDRPEEVVSFIRSELLKDSVHSCPVLVTYDPLLTLAAEESGIPNLLLLAPPDTTIALARPTFSLASCARIDIFWVESYTGGFGEEGKWIDREMASSEMTLGSHTESHQFSFDPEAANKRKLSWLGNASDLPDFRYVVTLANDQPSALQSIRKSLPDFEDANPSHATEY